MRERHEKRRKRHTSMRDQHAIFAVVKWGVFTSSDTETVPSGRVVHLLFGVNLVLIASNLT